jgi:hypothetical protein
MNRSNILIFEAAFTKVTTFYRFIPRYVGMRKFKPSNLPSHCSKPEITASEEKCKRIRRVKFDHLMS